VTSFEKRIEALLTRIAVALEAIAAAPGAPGFRPDGPAKFDAEADIEDRLGR
jgi:hypothetical protein